MKHCVYIRSNYQDFPLFLKRLDIMKATSVPSLMMQEGDFDVQVRVNNEQHAKLIASQTPFRPVLKYNFDGYDIQTRHDDDDIVKPGYIQKIQSFYDGTPKVVTFQIQKYDWNNNNIHKMKEPYSKTRCSMFSSLLNPSAGTNIFSRKHGELHELATVEVVDESYCFLVAHGYNKLTKV